MKNILVPTDFSNCANYATEVTLQIAQKAKAGINFLHIMVTPVDWVKLDIQKEERYPEVRKKIGLAEFALQEWMQKAAFLGVKSAKILSFSDNTEAITQHAQSQNCDFIVMGSHGAGGLKEIMLGSNAQKVVSEATIPVLIIKYKMDDFKVRDILFSSTFREDVLLPFHRIVDFADLMKARIHLLYVNDRKHFEENRKSENRMKNFLEKCPRGTCSVNVYNDAAAESGILHFAEDRKMDIIAIVTHGNKGIFQSSLTERLVNHSQVPVLSMNILR